MFDFILGVMLGIIFYQLYFQYFGVKYMIEGILEVLMKNMEVKHDI